MKKLLVCLVFLFMHVWSTVAGTLAVETQKVSLDDGVTVYCEIIAGNPVWMTVSFFPKIWGTSSRFPHLAVTSWPWSKNSPTPWTVVKNGSNKELKVLVGVANDSVIRSCGKGTTFEKYFQDDLGDFSWSKSKVLEQ